MRRCVLSLLVGIAVSFGGIVLAVAPRDESAGQGPSGSTEVGRSVASDVVAAAVNAAAANAPDRAPTPERREKASDRTNRPSGRGENATGTANRRSSTNPRRDRRPSITWLDAPPADPAWCGAGGRRVVVDRAWQRAWLCDGGAIVTVIPVTSARKQPDPGAYEVYARDFDTFSDYGPRRSTLDRFIAFAIGEDEGARVGFHAVPRYEDDGALAQSLESVGSSNRFGDSSGCIRLLPEHAELLWGFLQLGDLVMVIS